MTSVDPEIICPEETPKVDNTEGEYLKEEGTKDSVVNRAQKKVE